jgi:hypothetical protein
MPRTSGTRPKGSGIPAKGASVWGGARGAADPAKRGRPPGVKNGEGQAAKARAILVESAAEVAARVRDVALDVNHPQSLQASLAVLNRVGLHERSGIEHSGEGGGPMRLEIEIVRPEDAGSGGV